MSLTIREFLAELDRHTRRLPLHRITALLAELDIELDDVREVATFGDKTYRRNLLHEGPSYQALIICWRSGQRSPIHDHHGSSCGVRVLEGVATETTFERTGNGMIYARESRELAFGSVCGSQDADIHQMSNLQTDGRDLVTLHIYSPPLLKMGTYSLTDSQVREFVDPVFEFSHGSGI